MKLKLFLLDIVPFLLIGLSCLLSYRLLDSIIIFLFYFILFKEYNRIGFINRTCVIYCSLYILIDFLSYSLMLVFIRIVILILVLFITIPHRDKVKKLLKLIPLNNEITIFYDRIEFNEQTYFFGFELMEKEMDWLSRKVLLRSKSLKRIEINYINNMSLGRNYFVNIS